MAGAVLGFTVAIATRPSLLGEPLPLRLLFSSIPQDQVYRDALTVHLIWGTLGIMVSGVLLLALAERLVFGAVPVPVTPGDGKTRRFVATGPASLKRYFVAVLVGTIFGLANATIIRPSVLGMPIPLETLISTNPVDASFRTSLWLHFGFAAAIGAMLSLALVGMTKRLIAVTPPLEHGA